MRSAATSAVLSAALAAACAPGPPAADAGVVEHALPGAHSHNDETRARPLDEALELRFASIEVDVLFYEGDLLAAHDLFTIAGGFEALYLEPLQARVDARGSVYGDGAPLVLWIDLKSDDAVVREHVHDALARTPAVADGALAVILTGDAVSKQAYVAEHGEDALACRDADAVRDDDPPLDEDPALCAYAVDFRAHVDDAWDGAGEAPARVREGLAALVDAARAKGRPLRMWGAPDTEASWTAQKEAGVDFVGADDLAGLAATYASPQDAR